MPVSIVVPESAHGQRVDVFLAQNLESHGITTRSGVQRLLSDDNVVLDGKSVQKNYRVSMGDVLICQIPAPAPYEAAAEDIPLDIQHEDDHLLVVNKPRGLVVHPAAGNYDGTLVNALLFHCGGSLSGIGGVLRPGIVHRLDKGTSGLMVVAKNDIAHQKLASQLADRTMGRVYNALCLGEVKQEKFCIDLPISRHPVDRKKMTVTTAPHAKNAITYIEVLERLRRHTLVSATLETGRTHQIRVHLSHIGHPVVGDEVYGRRADDGLLLHSTKIEFIHPATGKPMTFHAPWPDYFQKAVENLR